MAFVLYSEVVFWWEVKITIVISIGVIASVLCIEIVCWWEEGPLWEVPLYSSVVLPIFRPCDAPDAVH